MMLTHTTTCMRAPKAPMREARTMKKRSSAIIRAQSNDDAPAEDAAETEDLFEAEADVETSVAEPPTPSAPAPAPKRSFTTSASVTAEQFLTRQAKIDAARAKGREKPGALKKGLFGLW